MPLKQPALAGMPFSEPGRWEYFLSHVQRGHSHPEKRRIMVATVAAICLLVWTLWPPAACTRSTPPRWRLTVFTIYKNERDVIEEWMDHYVNEGVEHFVLVDNGSTDNTTVPARYASMVVWIYDARPRIQQWWLHSNMLHEVDTAWLLPLDMDEYAFAKKPSLTVRDVLDKQPCTTSRIQLESYRFGDSGLKWQPESVRLGFVRRASHTDPDTPKTVVRPERVVQFWVHRHRMRNPVLDRPHWSNAIQLNHYGSMTLERWRRVQMQRGSVSASEHLDKERDEAEFAQKNRNEVLDHALAVRAKTSN